MTILPKDHHPKTLSYYWFVFLLLLFTWCPLAWPCADNFIRPTASNRGLPVRIINLESSFKKFLAEAPGKPYAEQIKIWDEVIEKDHPNFFDKLVWEKDFNPNWQDDKQRILKYHFPQIFTKLRKAMLQEFASFDAKVTARLRKFLRHFPDANLPQDIYAGPAINFTGKAHGGHLVGFGIDLITQLEQDLNIIFDHELFHIYHQHAAQIDKYFPHSLNEFPLALLWKEGLASYAVHTMNQASSLLEVLNSKELSQVSEEGLYWMAYKFLADISWPRNDFDKITDKWFVESGDAAQRDDLPARSGYLLGYRVMQMIAYYSECSVADLAQWNYFQVRRELMRVLATLANQHPSHQKPDNFYVQPKEYNEN